MLVNGDMVWTKVLRRASGRTGWSLYAFSFSFFHMDIIRARFSSSIFVCSMSSSVSMRIWRTLGSRAPFRSWRVVSTNFWSKFLVKVAPGLSANMRKSMMALYCHDGREV